MNKKAIILTLLLYVAGIHANAQFLFRISGEGIENPSYILGTIHTLSGSLLDSIPEFLEAESKCQQIYVEQLIKMNQVFKYDKKKDRQTLKYPDGKTIFDVIDKESADILKEKFMETLHIDLTNPSSKSFLNMLPSHFMDFLTNRLASQVRKQNPNMQGGLMDYVCVIRAKTHNKKVGELDDSLMLDKLFKKEIASTTIEAQADSLMTFLKNYDEYKQKLTDDYAALCDYWIKGDYEGFANSKQITEIENNPTFYKDRNENWVPKIKTALKEAPTMFVFGAGHLIGQYGVIQLLREAGYKVEQVKNNTISLH